MFGVELSSPNKGCSALGYSFIKAILDIIENKGNLHFYVVSRSVTLPDDVDLKGACLTFLKIENKNPAYYLKLNKLIKVCDIVFDFTEGDSFTELYGIKRFVLTTLMKEMVLQKKKPLILGPQTYGPIYRKLSRNWLKRIIKRADEVFVRDQLSLDFLCEVYNREFILTNDVAFELPYTRNNKRSDKIKIGINPSGLLWNGGYTKNNQFDLSMDYRKYIRNILKEYTQNDDYEVHLIAHVITEDIESPESDNCVCNILHNEFSNTIIAPVFETPIEAKSYISTMDCFIGSRMHATIASFSAGVATIPVSYSRKFEGLYGSLKYPYIICATKCSDDEAIKLTIEWINNMNQLLDVAHESNKIIDEKRKLFYSRLKEVLKKYN